MKDCGIISVFGVSCQALLSAINFASFELIVDLILTLVVQSEKNVSLFCCKFRSGSVKQK